MTSFPVKPQDKLKSSNKEIRPLLKLKIVMYCKKDEKGKFETP